MPSQGQDLKQGVYKTPKNFMAAVKNEFLISFDLAADNDTTQASAYFDEKDDSLSDSNSWQVGLGGWLWLNPPYNNIGAWAKKCAEECQKGAKILLLVPASVGSNWYYKYVEGIAEVRFLRPRLVFDFIYPDDYKDPNKAGKPNKDPYPKDMMLCIYDKERFLDGAADCKSWNWQEASSVACD